MRSGRSARRERDRDSGGLTALAQARVIVVMGRVAAPHGVRGALRVQPVSGEPGALLAHGEWWLRPPGGTTWRGCRLR